MKLRVALMFSVLFFSPLISNAFDRSKESDFSDQDLLSQCSAIYLYMEHKLNSAYEFMLKGSVKESIRVLEEIEYSLDNNDIPIQEKICIANRASKGYFDLYENEKGLIVAEKYLDLAKESLPVDDYLLGKAYENLGALQRKKDDFNASNENLIHAVKILKSYSNEFLIYHQLARYYLETDQYQKSNDYFKLAVEKFDLEDKSVRNKRDQFFVFFGYAVASIRTSDFAKTEYCTIMMEKLSQELQDPFLIFLVNIKYAEYLLNSVPQTKKALQYLNREIPNHPFVDHYKSSYYYYHGVANIFEGQNEKARDFFQLAIKHQLFIGEDAQKIGQFHIWLARSYNRLAEPEKALETYQEALCYYAATEGNQNTAFSQIENNIGYLYFTKGDLEKAKEHYLKALNWNSEKVNWRIKTLSNIGSVHVEHFIKSNQKAHVDSILRYMDLKEELLQQLRIEHRYFADQSTSEYVAYDMCNRNLDILEYLYNSNQGYDFLISRIFKNIEGVKTYSFRKELKEQEGLHTFGVPDELIDKIDLCKKEVKSLQDEIYKLESGSSNTFTANDIIEYKKQELEGLVDNYNSTILNIESNYPNYFHYKFNNNTVSIEDVQSLLKPNEAFIEYFSSDTSIFIISIEDDAINYINKRISDDWEEIVSDYADSLTKSEYQHQDSTSITYMKFTNSSHELFNFILKDALDLIDEEVTHLTIVPDEQLHFIQFDNLLMKKADVVQEYKDLDYVINDFTISRSESAFMYTLSKNKTRKHKKYKYIGFAPDYNNDNIAMIDSLESHRRKKAEYLNDLVMRGTYCDLPSARKSVNLISSILNGISFLGKKANKQTFLKRSQEGNILHFAGHAIMDKDPKFSQLLFSNVSVDSQLYASDIYEMDLDIDLVVLSACNTGNGKTKYGEGVMSLSRAFKFAGCSSLVMSLWSIPDVQTAAIDYNFFRNIHKGERIDDALRNSKLKFLNEATYQTAHPFYWSGLTASGKMEPVNKLSVFNKFWNLLNLSR